MRIKISRCMSTQHPDNARVPFFSDNSVMDSETEIKEAYYVFSHLNCNEQMWDYEGKEVDNFVVKKLLSRYEYFFEHNVIGRDVFITPRVPNPSVEKAEAKVLLETLESIPRSFDAARLFYGRDIAPIFEVILPMTTSHSEINRIYEYYKVFVSGKADFKFSGEKTTIKEWIGDFKPERIGVIPLVEDKEHMLGIDSIVGKFLADKDFEYQRVFLARSDPALNYGMIAAVIMNKVALFKLSEVEEETGIKIYPIIGKGSSPFRGNLNPRRVDDVLNEYPSVHTFTIQSAFKYDYPENEVRDAVEKIKNGKKGRQESVSDNLMEIMERYSDRYRVQVEKLAKLINTVAHYVPQRRRRKLHIGLFGYSRNLGRIKLPRAIKFTGALYSLGIPPEILGLDALSEKDIDSIREHYRKFDNDIADALRYVNKENINSIVPFGKKIISSIENLGIEYDVNEEHRKTTRRVVKALGKNDEEVLKEEITKAAVIRGFLG